MNDDAELFPQQAEILLEKCFNGQAQPDFNDFDSVLNCVSRMDTVKKLQYKDYTYMINTEEAVQVAPGIYFELMKQTTEDPKTGLVQKIKYRLYSDELSIKDIKDYIRKCRQEYESQRNNKLGNEVFFFDQITSKDCKSNVALLFDKKKFETNRTFDNVFFEEKNEVEGRVKHFMTNKAWYAKRGIPYTLGFMFSGAPGCGKCEAFGTMILKYDGTSAAIETLKVGDELMGDGSQPRTVMSTTQGFDRMYRVKQGKGDDYVVNSVHVLSLKLSIEFIQNWNDTESRYRLNWYENFVPKTKSFTVQENKKSRGERYIDKSTACAAMEAYKQALIDTGVANRKGDVCDIPINEYLNKSTKWKHAFKGYTRGIVDWWPHKKTTMDPYMMGYWIGDGTSSAAAITSQDAPVLKYFATNVGGMGPIWLQHADRYTYNITSGSINGGNRGPGCNSFTNSLKQYNVWKNKHVPDDYKFTDVDSRRAILAGFLDADGHLRMGNCFEYTQKSRVVFDDIAYIARSLGLTVSECKPKELGGTQYWRAHIYGYGIDLLPTKCCRKQARDHAHNKDPHSYEITIIPEPTGNYAGFTLDGNGRYCHADFSVTHNTSTIKAIANITTRHVINVRLSDLKTNSQLKNLFYNPVLQVMNPETMQVEKFTVPIHQRLYVIEDIDCMGNLVKHRDYMDSEEEEEPKKRKKDKVKDAVKEPVKENTCADTDDELEQMHAQMLTMEVTEMKREKIDDEDDSLDKITLDSLLNILDGTLEIPDRMICITTNRPGVIDDALIRPGRIDMNINFKKANRAIIREQFESFYDDEFDSEMFDKLRDYKLSPAVVNQVMFKHFTVPKVALEELVVMSNKRKAYRLKKLINPNL